MSTSFKTFLTHKEASDAFRVGVARSLAEHGLNPGDAEAYLQSFSRTKLAEFSGRAKTANGPTMFEQAFAPVEALGGAAIIAGGALGAATGHLRHQVENRLDDKGDPQADELQRKIDGYQQMTRELQTAHAAGLSA